MECDRETSGKALNSSALPSGIANVEQRMDQGFLCRDLVGDDVPDDLPVYTEIGMDQGVPHPCHCFPGNLRVRLPERRREVLCRLAIGKATFQNFMALIAYLEDLFGRRVDLVTTGGIDPYLRPTIEGEVIWCEA